MNRAPAIRSCGNGILDSCSLIVNNWKRFYLSDFTAEAKMGFLGILLYITTAGWMVYYGYTVDLNYAYLLAAPLGFMFGHILRKGRKTSTVIGSRNRNVLVSIINLYLIGLLLVAIFFGIGYGLMFIMEFRPPAGAGSI